MIDQDLLTAKGTIDGLLALSDAGADGLPASDLAEDMDVSQSTARNRMDSLLEDHGLVKEKAALVDNTPTRVYSLSPNGYDVADALEAILGEAETDEADVSEEAAEDEAEESEEAEA